jgi:deoxycytidine triphosphate deaminase
MFINPKHAIEKGWIKGNITDKHIQPNAIDFTLDRVFNITGDPCVVAEFGKSMRPQYERHPIPIERELYNILNAPTSVEGWILPQGSYDCMSDFYVQVPAGVAATLIVRSTFNRNGVFITSGLYDSGFQGHIGFVLHNLLGQVTVPIGTRVGQLIFVASENAGVYAGGWNHEIGTHHSEKT